MTQPCHVCSAYLKRRANVLAPVIQLQAFVRSVDPGVVITEFLHAVHHRHTHGHSLSTRPYTPHEIREDGAGVIHVKRACNGCGNDLGDVRDDEVAAAAAGRSLPDVRLECGCLPEAVQAA